jgi:hypothetical protein
MSERKSVILPPLSESNSPMWAPPLEQHGQREESVQGSPLSDPFVPKLSNSFDIRRLDPNYVEPQRPLPYCVAIMLVHFNIVLHSSCFDTNYAIRYVGKKMVPLKRKVKGRDFPKGRELVIVDEKGDVRLNHRSKSPFTLST